MNKGAQILAYKDELIRRSVAEILYADEVTDQEIIRRCVHVIHGNGSETIKLDGQPIIWFSGPELTECGIVIKAKLLYKEEAHT